MSEHAGPPATPEEVAAQAETIVALRSKLAAAEKALFEAGKASGHYIIELQAKLEQARAEAAVMARTLTAMNRDVAYCAFCDLGMVTAELERRGLRGDEFLLHRAQGGRWFVHRNHETVCAAQGYATVLEAFEAAAKDCPPPGSLARRSEEN